MNLADDAACPALDLGIADQQQPGCRHPEVLVAPRPVVSLNRFIAQARKPDNTKRDARYSRTSFSSFASTTPRRGRRHLLSCRSAACAAGGRSDPARVPCHDRSSSSGGSAHDDDADDEQEAARCRDTPAVRRDRLAAGYLYEAHLRAELSHTLGLEWETTHKGWAELRGVPRRVIDEFSTRRLAVVERLREQAASGFYAAQVAAVETRDRKEQVDLVALREDWRARAAEHGLCRRELQSLLGQARQPEPTREQLRQIAQRLLAPTGLTEKRTAFSAAELVMAWAEALPQGASVERVRRLCERFLGLDGVERVGEAPAPGRPAHYSTLELMQVEQAALALVDRGRDSDAPALTTELLDHHVANAAPALSAEQEAMVRKAAFTRDRIVSIIGVAGAGKTTAAHVLAAAFAAEGVPVLGAAPSGVAAEKLQDETGVPATTLHRLLDRDPLPHGCVVVVDEAGMAETRILAPLLDRIEAVSGKAILIGDPQQLPAVGAGGLFAAIVERHGAIILRENRRQQDELERKALAAVRAGIGRDYLAFAEQQERLVVADDPLTTKTRLLADWWASARDDLAGNVMIALRRRDVAELNMLARALMDSHGRLGAERLTVASHELAAGDRVVCLRNSDRLGVKNGTRGTIQSVDLASQTATVATDRGEDVVLPRRYLERGHVRHAYALTGHARQGLTVNRAFVLGSAEARLQEWGYVALSRAREQTKLYVTGALVEREAHPPEADKRDPLVRFGQALEKSAGERLAIDQRPLPTGPRHEARAEIERGVPDQRRGALRLLEQERVAAGRLRATAQQRLRDAENELEELGLLGRRRRSTELRATIEAQKQRIKLVDEQLRQLEQRRQQLRQQPGVPRREAPSRQRDHGLAVDAHAPEL